MNQYSAQDFGTLNSTTKKQKNKKKKKKEKYTSSFRSFPTANKKETHTDLLPP